VPKKPPPLPFIVGHADVCGSHAVARPAWVALLMVTVHQHSSQLGWPCWWLQYTSIAPSLGDPAGGYSTPA